MKTLDAEFLKVKDKLREVLSQQKYLCITADVWSSRAQSYLGVTVHFLNSGYKRESYLLAFKQLHFRQTYKELANALNDIFKEYGIKKTQITNIVTDGGSSFCKMFKVYGKSIDAIVSTYDEDGNTSGTEEEVVDDIVMSTMLDINGEPFVNEILQFDNVDANNATIEQSILGLNESFELEGTEATSENEFGTYFGEASTTMDTIDENIDMPPQRRCVSHLLNLLSQDFEKKYLNGLAKTALCKTLSKLHVLWVLTHRSSKAKTICKEVLGQILKVPSETRWNSRFDAVKMCSKPEIQKNLNKLIQQIKTDLSCASAGNLQFLTANDFAVIEQYIKVTEPVALSLDIMQKEYNSSQGFIMPILFSMKHRITQTAESTNIARDFKASMLNAINNRFMEYFTFKNSNKDLILSAITLPRVKTTFIAEDDDIIFAKNLLISECKKIKSEAVENVTQPMAVVEEDDDEFIISYSSRRDIRRSSIESEIESEVSRFLFDIRSDNSILDEFPTVKAVYFKYNTTLSSSAPIERVFSQSLMIFTPRRNRLSATRFEQAIILKHNRKLLYDNTKLGKV